MLILTQSVINFKYQIHFMKKLTFLALSIVLSLYSCESEKHIDVAQVPQSVKEAFAKKYPNATDIEWIQEGKSKIVYEAEFKFGGKKITAEFSESGEFLEEE